MRYNVYIKKLKVILTILVLVVYSGAEAGWDAGLCPVTGATPCIEHSYNGTSYHINGTGDHADQWHGNINDQDFTFRGDFVFTCPNMAPTSCELQVETEIKKFQDAAGAWSIGVRINDAVALPGSMACSLITFSGFPWYSSQSSTHSGFGETTGMPYSGNTNYVGNYGGSAASGGISVSVLGAPLVSGAHIHNVDYDNINTFEFDSDLYTSSGSSGCSMIGRLFPFGLVGYLEVN